MNNEFSTKKSINYLLYKENSISSNSPNSTSNSGKRGRTEKPQNSKYLTFSKEASTCESKGKSTRSPNIAYEEEEKKNSKSTYSNIKKIHNTNTSRSRYSSRSRESKNEASPAKAEENYLYEEIEQILNEIYGYHFNNPYLNFNEYEDQYNSENYSSNFKKEIQKYSESVFSFNNVRLKNIATKIAKNALVIY